MVATRNITCVLEHTQPIKLLVWRAFAIAQQEMIDENQRLLVLRERLWQGIKVR